MNTSSRMNDSSLLQKDAISDMLLRLQNCAWFACVGENDLQTYGRVSSWKETVKLLTDGLDSGTWEWGLEESNRFGAKAFRMDRDKFNREWNPIAEEVATIVRPVMQSLVMPVLEKDGIDNIVCIMCETVLLNYCVSLAYFDDPDYPSLSRECLELLLAGHCPCGFVGEYPDGKLIVY